MVFVFYMQPYVLYFISTPLFYEAITKLQIFHTSKHPQPTCKLEVSLLIQFIQETRAVQSLEMEVIQNRGTKIGIR